jgi:hypothetical protein
MIPTKTRIEMFARRESLNFLCLEISIKAQYMHALTIVIRQPRIDNRSIEGLFSRNENANGTAAIEMGRNSKKEFKESLK